MTDWRTDIPLQLGYCLTHHLILGYGPPVHLVWPISRSENTSPDKHGRQWQVTVIAGSAVNLTIEQAVSVGGNQSAVTRSKKTLFSHTTKWQEGKRYTVKT